MPAKKISGFSLIELVVVIALIAIIATIVIPRIGRKPLPLNQQFLRELNSLLRTTQLNGIITGKLHRIFFDLKDNVMRIEQITDKSTGQDKPDFKPLKLSYTKTSYPLNPDLEINRFMVKGKNLIQQGEGFQFTGAWFYLAPDGLAQEATIGITEKTTGRTFSLAMNPFVGQLSVV